MVWQPVEDNMQEYSKFFTRILEAGIPSIVNIDESINMKFGSSIPRGLSILLAQGRLPGIHVMGGTQEVAKAPRQMLSQATYLLSFGLLNQYDNRTMAQYLRVEGGKLNLKKHHFLFLDTDIDMSNPILYTTYRDFIPHVK